MNFSDKIKFQREQNHLTQKELAELVGVSQRAIAAYESSGTIARISTMRKLAHLWQVYLLKQSYSCFLSSLSSCNTFPRYFKQDNNLCIFCTKK